MQIFYAGGSPQHLGSIHHRLPASTHKETTPLSPNPSISPLGLIGLTLCRSSLLHSLAGKALLRNLEKFLLGAG